MKKILLNAVCMACLIGYPGGSVKAVNNSDNQPQPTKQAKKNKQLDIQKQNLQGNSQATTRPQLASPATTLNHHLLANKIDGQLTLKVDLGYVLQFSRKLGKSYQDGNTDSTSLGAASGFGYGASFGYTSNKGWGISVDYLRFNRKWNDNIYAYNTNDNIITLTPSYRFGLDNKNQWGIRFGLGFGVLLSDIKYSAPRATVAGTAARTSLDDNFLGGECPFRTDNNGLKVGDTVEGVLPPFRAPTERTALYVNAQNLPEGNIGPNQCVRYDQEKTQFRPGGPERAIIGISGLSPLADTAPQPIIKGSIAMVMAPQVSVEYDNGYFHADINARYIATLQKFNYANKDEKNNIKYNSNPGSLAFFVGAGLGINF